MIRRSIARKPIVRKVLADLKKSNWIGPARQWWPNFVFHFTDIQNAVSILKEGSLLSRNEVERRNLMHVDNASAEIIEHTDEKWKDYVRLYFRPRTPTQYRNEGMRPRKKRQLNAHCPVPIYFLFDAVAVLSEADTCFTDGNLAANPSIFCDANDLKDMPFRKVYHDSYFDRIEASQIVFHRNAEILVPRRMNLNALNHIVCRSQAEYEMLIHLLPAGLLRKWSKRIVLGNRLNLFFKRWAYIDSVELDEARMLFHFKNDPEHVGPFHAKAFVTDMVSSRTFSWEEESFTANRTLSLRLKNIGPLSDYSIRLSLDDNIAYANRYQEESLPW